MTPVTEHAEELDSEPVFWRSAPVRDGGPPVLYVHGLGTSADIWAPFLEATGGVAVDLPGFGRSTKRGDLDVTIAGYGRFLDRFVEHAGLERLRLVVHGWGAIALPWAAARADRVTRIAVIAGLPFTGEDPWPRRGRALRRRLVGEVAMGLATRPVVRWASRGANGTPGPLPRPFLDGQLAYLDQGTQRAILRILRATDGPALAEAGARLAELRAPALVVQGARDPYLPDDAAERLADRLGGHTEIRSVPNAGHFPWLDDPKPVWTVSDFLSR